MRFVADDKSRIERLNESPIFEILKRSSDKNNILCWVDFADGVVPIGSAHRASCDRLVSANSATRFMRNIPTVPEIDSTLSLVSEGYCFISTRCERLQSDIFQTRVLFKKTICMRGEEAAKVFYDTEKFSRKNAAPKRLQKTLLGEGGVQGLDGEAHRQRKQLFMALMTPDHIAQLTEITRQQWLKTAEQWEQRDRIVLLHEAQRVLCQAVCAWAGVPLPVSEVDQHTQELAAMIDGSGGIALRYLQGVWGRQQAEKWIEAILDKIRSGELEVPENTAAHAFAWGQDAAGGLLDKHVAAVELLNVLRPTVAIARYVTFAALALHQHPEWVQNLKDDADNAELFTQEVRRFYPFFPFAAARTSRAFEWQNYHFPKGVQVLLDLYGTNHHPQLWDAPKVFRPERFREWNKSKFSFIPQGGGDYDMGHRCAGEWITMHLMKMTLNFLTRAISYDVPEQNLEVSMARLPTMPKSGFIIRNVKRIE